jgi:uncharacterized protein (DUF1501 family)
MKNINRRDFLKIFGAGTGALAVNGFVPRFFNMPAYAAPSDRCVINLFQDGGCDGLTMCHPQGNTAFMTKYRQIRPTLSMPLLDNAGVEMARLPLAGTDLSLHFRLTELQTLFNRGQLAITPKAGIQFNSGSHEEAQAHVQRGVVSARAPEPTAGWMKRVAIGNGFTDSFQMFDRTGGGGLATLGVGPYRPLSVTNFASYGFTAATTGEFNFRLDTTFALLGQQEHNARARDYVGAYDSVEESVDRVRTAVQGTILNPAFPNTGAGNQLKDAFIAIMNFGTRFAYTQFGGFDLHSDTDRQGQNRNTPMGMSNRMREMNDAIAAFRLNCERVGKWGDMVIVVNSEFGRTNNENGSFGVDHADAHVCFVMGGGVKGGVYGDRVTVEDISRPQNGIDATTSPLDIYNEIVSYMGLSTSGLVFPGYTPRALGLFA